MCACPCAMFFLSLRRTFLAPARLLGGILSSTPEVIGPNHGLLLPGLLLAGHGLLLALAGAGVRLGALAMHRQPAPVPQALVAADLDLAPDVRLDLPAQIALDLVVRLDPVPQLDDLVVGHLVDPGVRADAGGPQRLKRPGPADAVDVGEGDLKPLLPREFDADQACHRGQLSFSSGGPAHRPAPVPAGAAPASSRGCPGACAAPGCGTCSAVVAAGSPCRCLCLGSLQMTITRPCRRMIRHLLQIFFTLGLTFIWPPPPRAPAAGRRGARPVRSGSSLVPRHLYRYTMRPRLRS